MKLLCYALTEVPPKIAPARPDRAWMDVFQDKHAYRCLPLSIANAHGWDILMPAPIEVEWNGGPEIADLKVKALKPLPGNRPVDHFVRSNFSRGIVTFNTDYIFRTEPGWDLLATGPFNRPKDNASPLSGIIESDWLPYPFTMNWQILRPGRVLFEQDEPFCFIFPLPKQALIDCEPEIRRLADEPELKEQHDSFRNARDEFMKRMREGDQSAIRQGWQRHYFVGRFPDGKTVEGHLNKLRLKEPVDRRPPRPLAAAPVKAAALASPAPRRHDPRWEDDSVLNEIERDQNDRNYAGRARLDREGRLTDDRGTYRVRSAADAEGCDFLYIENFFSAAECSALRRAFEALQDRVFHSDKIDPYWNGRFVWLRDILAANLEAGRLMIERQRKSLALVSAFYRLKAPIYSDLLQIVQWKPGMAMPFHADNINPDGSPHGMAYRDFSGVAYLNDDYEGGELYFTALDIAVKPQRGAFLAFTAGFHHEHAVLRVTAGNTRLTIPSFYTFTAAKADPMLHPETVRQAATEQV
jgi:hypothetical protein